MRWSYKTVHFCMKKDGLLGNSFLDEDEIEITLNEYGRSGWELVSLMEVTDGVIAVFKQPFGYGLPDLKEVPTDQEKVVREEIRPPISGKECSDQQSKSVSFQREESVEKQENITKESDVGSIRID